MKTFFLLLAVALLACAAQAAVPADFGKSLTDIHASVMARLKGWRPRPPKTSTKSAFSARVADPAAFQRLINRARQEKPQPLIVDGTPYQIYSVISHNAIAGQNCAKDAQPLNALYDAEPNEGPGRGIYPVRLISVCVEPSLTQTNLTVIADKNGFIREMHFFGVTHPETYLAALVKLLSENP